MKKKVEVALFGKRFTVRSEKDEAYVHSLSNYVTRKFEELRRQARTISSQDLALLVALNIADELFEAEERAAQTRGEVRERSERLLQQIDAALASAAAAPTEETEPALAVAGKPDRIA